MRFFEELLDSQFHILEDVHPQLPSPNHIIHEMSVGKIDVYTRFLRKSEAFGLGRRACGSAPIGCSARAESELKASVEKLFDEGGSTEQVDSATGRGPDAEIEFVTAAEDTTAGSVAAKRPKHPRKKRPIATDASGSSHPPKKLILSTKASVSTMSTLPFVTSSVSATLEHKDGALLDSVTRANLCSAGLVIRFVIFLDSSYHSSTNAPGAEVDSVTRSTVLPLVTTKVMITTSVAHVSPVLVPRVVDKVIHQVQQFIFHESTFADTIKPDAAGLSHPPGKRLSLGSREVDYENLHEVFFYTGMFLTMLYWMILILLENLLTTWLLWYCSLRSVTWIMRSYLRSLTLGLLVKQLSAKVRMRTEYCLSERKRLKSECERQADLLKSRDEEVENLKAQLFLKESEAAKAARLFGLLYVHALESICSSLHDQVFGYEQLKQQIKEFQDVQMSVVNEKVAKLDVTLLEIAFHFEERFYPHFLATISVATVTTTALSITFASTSSVPLIYTDDYEIIGVDGQEGAGVDGQGDSQGNATAFSTVEFEKEELDTTLTLLKVGMPISTGITASIPYVSENGVSPLLDLIIVRWAKLVGAILLSASAFLFAPLGSNMNLRAYVNSTPSGFVITRPASEPSMHDDSFVNSIHGFGSSLLSSMGVSRGSSSGRSTMKSAKI
uniref:Uncharacterized protein n=1 Tax=Tanacetum cinerariifolium TaxID=118510 RepID=A0A6L2MM63_TANCI|nr:hypothetical protein [Tanacetum cinerariifolium]